MKGVVVPFQPARSTQIEIASQIARCAQTAKPMPKAIHDCYLILSLAPETVVMWMRLRSYLWHDGPIAGDAATLAKIAGVTMRRWEKNGPVLRGLFDHARDGTWFDRRLEHARQKILAHQTKLALKRLQRQAASPVARGDERA